MSTPKDRTATSKNPSNTPKKPRTAKKSKRQYASRIPFSLADRLGVDDARFTVKEIQQLACCSRTKLTVDRRAGKLVTIQQGRSVRATGAAVRDYLASLETPDLPPDPRAAHLPRRQKQAAPPPPQKTRRPSRKGAAR